MSEQPANLLNALFEFRPRDGHTPKENFLTEAFVHVLRTSKPACNAWLSLVMQKKSVEANWISFQTRRSEREQGTVIYPDLLVEAELSDGQLAIIYSEHKWESLCISEQLKRYIRLAEQRDPKARVIFIGSNHEQVQEANKTLKATGSIRYCFRWQEVFSALSSVAEAERSDIFKQFLDFMKDKGLSPGTPMTAARLKAFYNSEGIVESFERSLEILLEKEWPKIPERYRKMQNFHRANGTLTLLFATERWRPAVTVGFLHDPSAYGVAITNKEKGIDLLLRLSAGDAEELSDVRMRPALPILQEKRGQLGGKADSALLVREKGNGDKHALLIVQSCLADVIEGATTDLEQIDLIYRKLSEWIEILFGDGRLDGALQAAGLNGMYPGS